MDLKCNLCSAEFEFSPTSEMTLHACAKCGNLCSIKPVRKLTNGMPVYEFHGCSRILETAYEATTVDQPAGIEPVDMSLITDSGEEQEGFEKTRALTGSSEPTQIHQIENQMGQETMLSWIQEDAESKEEAALEGTVSFWKIVRDNGQSLQFHFLTALRKWIMDGRVSAGDWLYTVGGAKYRIEEYPGTADLFKNIDVVRERRRHVLANKRQKAKRPNRVEWRHLKKRHLEIFIAGSMLFFALLWGAHAAWQQFEFRQSAHRGFSYLQGLSRMNLAATAVKDLPALTTLVWTDDAASIQLAITSLTNQLSQEHDNLDKICLLSESFVRRAALSGNLSELSLADNLLNYVKYKDVDHACRWRAEAVYYWSQGASKLAIKAIDNYMKISDDAYGSYVRGLLAVDQQELQEAKRFLNDAEKQMPNNIIFLSALAKILEKEEKWNEAIALLEDALTHESMSVDLMKRLGFCYEKSGNLYEAEKVYQRGLQLTDNPEEFQYLLVSLYNNHNKYQDAIRAASHYMGNFPEGTHTRLVQQLSDQAQSAINSQHAEQMKLDARRNNTNTRRRIWMRR